MRNPSNDDAREIWDQILSEDSGTEALKRERKEKGYGVFWSRVDHQKAINDAIKAMEDYLCNLNKSRKS